MIAASFASLLVSAASLNETQEQQLIEINELLRANPSVIGNLHESLGQYAEGLAQLENVKAQSQDWLYNNPDHSITGNPDGKSVIINFTDYNCPYCKKLDVVLAQLAEENSDLKVVNIYLSFKQQMISGLETNSALYALNVWKNDPESFVEVNRLLVAKGGIHNKQSLEAVARKTKTEQWLKTGDEQNAIMAQNYQVFTAMGLRGTPGMLVGEQLIPGFVPYEKLKDIVDEEFSK